MKLTKLIPILLFISTTISMGYSQQQFISAVVVHQKDLDSSDSNTTAKKIADFVKESSEKNFNTIIFSFEKEKFLVPKSSSAKESLCLSYLLQETKKYNIKLFVMIDTLKVENEKIFSWLCKSEDKNYYVPYYYSPGNPEVQQYLINLTKNLLTTYEIDGIIFDNICYPEKNVSYDETSLYRFYTRGNPKLLDFFDYQKEQLNLLISRLYCTAKSINKNVSIGVTTKSEYKNPQMLSGYYYENFQDVKLWLEKNWVDFVVVKLKNINDIKNFVSVIPKDKIVGLISSETDQSNVNNLIQSNILGCILNFIPKNNYFVPTLSFPKFEFNYKILSGYVVDETSSPLEDVWITLLSPTNKELGFTLTTKNGEFYFIHSSTSELVLKFDYTWCETILSTITVSEGFLTTLPPTIIPNASVEKNKLFFYIHQPTNLQNYQKDTIHILGRTYPKYNVSLYTENFSTNVKVYPTGMFAVDNIKLSLGENILVFTISDPTKTKFTQQQIKVVYTTTTVSLPAEEKEFVVLSPTEDLLLFSGDVLELKIKSKKNKKFYAICFDNKEKIYLDEISDGVYYKRYLIPPNFSSNKTQLVFCYDEEMPKKFFWERKKIETVSYPTDYYVEVWNSAYPLIAETVSEKTPMIYGLHYVRLGGPYITELPKGIKLQVVGKQQGYYKIKLSASLSGWVDQKDVKLNKISYKIPHNYFTYCSISSEKNMDKIWLPWVEQVPFSVSSLVEDNKTYLIIDFFCTHFATTWLTYKSQAKILDNFKIEQKEDDWLRVKIPVKTKQLWGYSIETSSQGITIYVKYPPKIYKENPLKNITIALEAGHGGDTNTGAIGLSGSKEKDINYRAVMILKSLLEKNGAKVVLMRVGDTNPDFSQRIKTAVDNNADIIVSIHGNAGSNEKGFLRVAGTSVYYKYDHCKLLAECIYKELLPLWKNDFGLVGNFNYTPLRQTLIPAVLVEQGFLTHPYDESLLLDKTFLQNQAEAILVGIKNFLSKVAE
jgi:N-acetylmuramoyl-L-alanine amidase